VDIVNELIERIVATTFNDLPAESVKACKYAILDTIASGISGLNAEGISELTTVMTELGGKPEASVWFRSRKLPVEFAATVNAALSRARDFDDCYESTGDHPAVAVIPAAFAQAEKGGQVSGKDFICAIVCATDFLLRIRDGSPLHLGPELPWTVATFAPLAAVACVGKLRGLPAGRIHDALGVAFTYCSNTMQGALEGVLAHRVHQGVAVGLGLLAVKLAEHGISGIKNVLEGPYGLYQALYRGKYERERIMENPKVFKNIGVSIKPYPCCKLTHGAIEGVMGLMSEHQLNEGKIADVRIGVNQSAYSLCARQPWTEPQSVVEAQFNIPYAVALAVCKQSVRLEDFTEKAIKDKAVLKMASKVRVSLDEGMRLSSLQVAPTITEIRDVQGNIYKKEVTRVKGNPQNPLSWDQLCEKFFSSLDFAGVPRGRLGELPDKIWKLEKADDIVPLIQYLV
jgi:2-methylcitrate dehydratase PrpD